MNEGKILRAILNGRSEFERIQDHIDKSDLSPEGSVILNEISEFYNVDPHAEKCDIEILTSRLERRLPNPKHAASCIHVLQSLPDVSGANVVQEILDIKQANLGLELATGFAGGKDAKFMRPLVERYLELGEKMDFGESDEEIIGIKVEDLCKRRLSPDGLIQLAPKSLNQRLDGGLRRGHHVVIFAPTEMGKTGFVVNAVRHFLRQDLKCLYVGNEDPSDDILLRVMCSITGFNKFEIRDRAAETQSIITAKGFDNLVFASLSPGTFPRITRLVRKYDPAIVILDQLSNIDVKASRNDSGSASLEIAAKAARALAKQENVLVISVTQAADSATGKAVLGRGDIHNSNVGIPGQADLMVGIGASREMESRGQRNLSLVKNKISGNHDNFIVQFNPVLSRVE